MVVWGVNTLLKNWDTGTSLMGSEELRTILDASLPGCHSRVDINGSHFNILVVSDLFDGKRAIQRQQMIYVLLKEHISSGAIHAINMKLYSKEEWQLQS